MFSAIAVLVLALGVVIVRGDQVGSAARPATNPRMIYLGPIDSIVQNLWSVDPSVSGKPIRLTDSKTGILDFDVSRDGQVVYTEQADQGVSNLMIYDVGRAESRMLYGCQDASCMEVAWRPDGKAVAFDRSALNTGLNMPPGAPRVWIFDTETGKAGPLFQDDQRLGYTPRWSPDGQKIAVFDVGSGGIIVHNFKTGKDTLIPAYQGTVGTFSPDSTRLWFPKIVQVADQQYATHIVIVDLSSDPYTQHDLIPDSAGDDDTDPIWMPDGKSLLVMRRAAGQPPENDKQIYQVDIASGAAKALITDVHYAHSNLALNAAGDTLLFQRFLLGGQGARPELWVSNLKTNETRKLADNGTTPHWLP